MKRHRSPQPTDDLTDKLAGVRPVAHDDDERPTREDRRFGRTVFNRPPVPLPRFLTGAKRPRPRDPNRRSR